MHRIAISGDARHSEAGTVRAQRARLGLDQPAARLEVKPDPRPAQRRRSGRSPRPGSPGPSVKRDRAERSPAGRPGSRSGSRRSAPRRPTRRSGGAAPGACWRVSRRRPAGQVLDDQVVATCRRRRSRPRSDRRARPAGPAAARSGRGAGSRTRRTTRAWPFLQSVFVPICSRVARLGPDSPSRPIQIASEALPFAGQVTRRLDPAALDAAERAASTGRRSRTSWSSRRGDRPLAGSKRAVARWPSTGNRRGGRPASAAG